MKFVRPVLLLLFINIELLEDDEEGRPKIDFINYFVILKVVNDNIPNRALGSPRDGSIVCGVWV